jgi:hypothetical protein
MRNNLKNGTSVTFLIQGDKINSESAGGHYEKNCCTD